MARKAGTTLGLSIFIVTALLVVLTAGSALTATFMGIDLAREAISDDLRRVNSALALFHQKHIRHLELGSRTLIGEEWFVQGLSTVAAAVDAEATDDTSELRSRLEELRDELGLDLVFFLGPDGSVAFRSGSSAKPALGDDLSADPLVPRIGEERRVSVLKSTSGLWTLDGALYHVVVSPLVRSATLLGFVGVASSIAPMADELRRSTGAQILILHDSGTGPSVIAAAVDGVAADAVVRALRTAPQGLDRVRRGETEPAAELQVDGQAWLGFLSPLRDAAEKPVGAAVGLVPLEGRLAIYRRIELLVVGAAGAALVVGFLLSMLIGRRILSPVNRLAAVMNRIRAGDYGAEVPRARGNFAPLVEPIRLLARKLNDQEALATYLASRGRELPEPAPSQVTSAPAARPMALVGIEMRRFANPKLGYDPEENVGRFARDLRRITTAVTSRQGRVEAVLGHRLLVVFEGESQGMRALAAATEILLILTTRENAFDEPVEPVVGLTKGSVVTGSVRWGTRLDTALAGLAVQQLESLLRESTPGEIFMAKPFAEEVYPAIKKAGFELQAQRGIVSPMALYKLTAQAAQGFTGVEPPEAQPRGVEQNLTLADLVPGEVLGGRFEILAELGRGASGAAFKARDNDRSDLVKLKILAPEVAADTARMDRLKAALELARMIAHPNVLTVLDYGQVDGLGYVSTAFVQGAPLSFFVAGGRPMPLTPAFLLARQIAEGLLAAHRQKLLHGAMKPENVLVEHGGRVRVMDFAMGTPLTSENRGAPLAGAAYLAPEVIEGRAADARADVYGWAAVFYALVTGRPPAAGSTPSEVVQARRRQALESPSLRSREMPAELDAIMTRCLEVEPSRRFASLDELVREIDALRA